MLIYQLIIKCIYWEFYKMGCEGEKKKRKGKACMSLLDVNYDANS